MLREEITQLEAEITSPLTPTPLRERLKQRTIFLRATADRHHRTRPMRCPATPRNPPDMSDDDERNAITAAMQRLLAGRPLRSSGDLTIVALAEEAGLRRNKLTHKHTDLKELFYAEVKARNGIPANEVKLREQITALKTRIESLRQERDDYRAATEAFARAINVLTAENDNLRKELDKRQSSRVTTMPKRP
jgi:hypothetical protein